MGSRGVALSCVGLRGVAWGCVRLRGASPTNSNNNGHAQTRVKQTTVLQEFHKVTYAIPACAQKHVLCDGLIAWNCVGLRGVAWGFVTTVKISNLIAKHAFTQVFGHKRTFFAINATFTHLWVCVFFGITQIVAPSML